MKTSSTLFFALAAALPLVAAHGILQDLTIDGKLMKGNGVGGPADPSGIRQVFSQDPIKGANNRDINCGVGAKPAALVLDANPGSKFEFIWKTASRSNWPHNTGPMSTYLASCGDVTCDKFDPTDAKWFKIQQVGRKKDGTWFQQDLMNGGVAPATLPTDLAPGNYIIRHEIIALHLATQPGGAEFYAGCAQLRVGGNEKGVPPPEALVLIPGVYKDNEPGILDPNVFDPKADYQFPGPKVATLVVGGTPTNPAKPSGNSSSGGEPNGQQGSGSCQLKAQTNTYRPRGISRIMRNLGIH